MTTTRTFVAVAASPDQCRQAEQLTRQLRHHASNVKWDDVKWVSTANYHWTLQFLGEVDDVRLADVCAAVSQASQQFEPFPLVGLGAGAFPSASRPRVLWIGAGQGGLEMVDLQSAVEAELAELGFGNENRSFVPHLTLGRAGRRSRPADLTAALKSFSDFEAGTMAVEEVVVFGSQLRREGPSYHVIGRAPLQAC